MSVKKIVIIGSRSAFKVVKGSRLVGTSKRVRVAMEQAKRNFDRIESQAKEDASILRLNA